MVGAMDEVVEYTELSTGARLMRLSAVATHPPDQMGTHRHSRHLTITRSGGTVLANGPP